MLTTITIYIYIYIYIYLILILYVGKLYYYVFGEGYAKIVTFILIEYR